MTGTGRIAWLPGARAVLKQEFGARPIDKQNLSGWKLGGYVDWERLEMVKGLNQCGRTVGRVRSNQQRELLKRTKVKSSLLRAKCF